MTCPHGNLYQHCEECRKPEAEEYELFGSGATYETTLTGKRWRVIGSALGCVVLNEITNDDRLGLKKKLVGPIALRLFYDKIERVTLARLTRPEGEP